MARVPRWLPPSIMMGCSHDSLDATGHGDWRHHRKANTPARHARGNYNPGTHTRSTCLRRRLPEVAYRVRAPHTSALTSPSWLRYPGSIILLTPLSKHAPNCPLSLNIQQTTITMPNSRCCNTDDVTADHSSVAFCMCLRESSLSQPAPALRLPASAGHRWSTAPPNLDMSRQPRRCSSWRIRDRQYIP